MNSHIHKYSHLAPMLVAIPFVLIMSYLIATEKERYTIVLLAAAVMIPITWVLLFRFRLFSFLIVLLIPLSIKIYLGGGAALSFPGELLTAIAALSGIFYYLVRKNNNYLDLLKHPITLLIIADIGWSIFTAILAEDTGIAMKRVTVKILFILVFYFLFAGYFKRLKDIPRVFLWYGVGMVIPIIHTLVNHAHYEFSKTVSFLMPLPFYNDHTLYATCIAYILPLILLLLIRPGWYGIKSTPVYRVVMISLLVLLMAGELFAFSRAAWLSVAISLIFAVAVMLLRFRMAHFVMVLLIAAGMIYHYSDNLFLYAEKVESVSRDEDVGEHMKSVINIQTDASNLERINRWSCALRMGMDKPVTGYGPGNYLNVYGRYQLTTEMTRISTNHGEKGNAHSEYLMYLSEMGIPGLIILILLIMVTLSRGIRIIRRSDKEHVRWLTLALITGFVGYFFHGLFNSFIDTDKASVLVYSTLAALTVIDITHFHQKTWEHGKPASEKD